MDIATLRVAQTDNSNISSSAGSRVGKDAGPSGSSALNTAQTTSAPSHPSVLGGSQAGNRQLANKSENHAQDASESMSQISGFRRSLSHANSLPGGESVPKFGVSTEKESELAEVKIQSQFLRKFRFESS